MATPKSAIDWLAADNAFQDVSRQGARLLELQAQLSACVPDIALTVIAMREDAVVVATRTTATAAKLRQQAPSVVAALGRAGWSIGRLQVKTMPKYGATPTPVVVREPLPDSAINALRELHGTIRDEQTRHILGRMIARHQRRRG